MNIFKLKITTILALMLPMALHAQIQVEAPGAVALDEQFNITFTLTQKPSSFQWQCGDDFTLVWGPQTGSSSSVSIINGKVSKSSQYTYTYVLMPKSKGRFTLSSAHAVVGGKDEYSKAPVIEVAGAENTQGAGSASSQQQPSSGNSSSSGTQNAQTQTPSGASSGADMLLSFSFSRTSVVVGEPITATLKLYTRGSIAGFEDVKFPTFDGFWSQEVEAPQNIEFQREALGERVYNAALLRKWVIIPQKSGQITVDPAELVCLVQQRISSGNSIFDGFFDDYQTVRKRVVSKANTVNVRALPSGAPSSFTGAVGKFRINASIGRDSLKVHEAASLCITVSGSGNVALVSAPKVQFPPDSEVYDVKTTDDISKGSGGTSGSRTFEYPFIPRSHGDFEIPPIDFSYYDVASRKYVTLSAGPVRYHVNPGEATDYVSGTGVRIPTSAGKDVKNLSEDIHFISTHIPLLTSEGKFFIGSTLFWILMILIPVTGGLIWFILSRIRTKRSDVVTVRTKAASKVARRRLALAGDFLSKNLYTAFYEELHKALLGYASDKLNIPSADLSKESIAAAFSAAGAPQELTDRYTALLDACEFARYAPDASGNAMKESYDNAMTVISSIDDTIKKKNRNGKGAMLAILLMILPFSQEVLNASDSYVDSLWMKGVAAYTDGDFAAAKKNFSAIESLGLSSPELYTNMADACFKAGELASAILYYERALKLDPSFKDARYNIEIARARCQDRIESVPEFFLKTWLRKICYSMPSNFWAWCGVGLLALTVAMVLLLLLGRSVAARRTGFFSGIVTLLLFALCIINAGWQRSDYELRDSAVVFRPVTGAKSAPADSGADLFVLHEGTKVKVLDSVGSWINICLSDGREGWIKADDAQII